jgi:hypothetical protein
LNSLETLDVALRVEDSSVLDGSGFLASTFAPEPNSQAEGNESTPPHSDALSLSSFTPSDTSPRWSISSFVNSTNFNSGDFPPNGQYLDLPTPPLENSSRSHDSIGSVLSETYDLDFLANYDPISLHANQTESNPWWVRDVPGCNNGDFFNDSFTAIENPMATSGIHLPVETFVPAQEEVLAFEPPEAEMPEEYSQKKYELTADPALERRPDFALLAPSVSIEEIAVDLAQDQQHEPEKLMDWELAQATSVVPAHASNGEEIIPLTDVQRETLIKWWGRDRLTEQSTSMCGRATSNQNQLSRFDGVEVAGGGACLGRKNSLVGKVKAVYVPPPFRRGLWRSSSSGKERK